MTVLDGMGDGAATVGEAVKPVPSAHRCAAAGLDSGPQAERWAFMPFDDALDRVKLAKATDGIWRGIGRSHQLGHRYDLL